MVRIKSTLRMLQERMSLLSLPVLPIMLTLVILVSVHGTCLASEKGVLSLDDAIQMVLQNNYDLKITQLSLANNENEVKKNQLTVGANTRFQQLNLTLALLQSQQLYQTTRHEIITGLLKVFIELTNIRQNIDLAQEMLQIKELELQRINELYTRGSVTRGELLRARLEREEQSLIVHQFIEGRERLRGSLNNKLGLTEAVEFKEITPDCAPVALEEKAMFARAMVASSNVKEQEIRRQIAEVELEKANLEGQSELELQRFTNNLEIARYRLLKTKNELTITVKNTYADLTQALKVIETKKTEIALAEEHYKQMKLGFEHGIYSEVEYLESKVALLRVEMDLFSSQAEYYLKKLEFNYLLGQDELLGGSQK